MSQLYIDRTWHCRSPHDDDGEDVCRDAEEDDGGEDVPLAHAVELLHRRVVQRHRRIRRRRARV